MSGIGKSIETGSRLVVPRAGVEEAASEEGGNANGTGFLFGVI